MLLRDKRNQSAQDYAKLSHSNNDVHKILSIAVEKAENEEKEGFFAQLAEKEG